MKRREMLLASGAAILGVSAFPMGWTVAADDKKKKVLYFTRSQGFEHSVVRSDGDKPSFSDKLLTELGAKHNIEVVCSKDGGLFDGDLDQFDALVFYASGDLTAKTPANKAPNDKPMSQKGKQRLLQAVADGKPFVGIHAATDAFRATGDKPSEYIAMLGGEFLGHGWQQEKATMSIASPNFPGVKGLSDFVLQEEWYVSKNLGKDLHVILVQETAGMKDKIYQRPPYPATWARMHGKGRVFYTSMGHREDVWTNSIFQQILLGGLSWALGRVNADVTPNIDRVTPKAIQ